MTIEQYYLSERARDFHDKKWTTQKADDALTAHKDKCRKCHSTTPGKIAEGTTGCIDGTKLAIKLQLTRGRPL